MTEHKNAALLRRAFTAWLAGDTVTLADSMAVDMVWHVAGESTIAGDYHGREAIFSYLERIQQLSGGTFRPEGQDILASDAHAALLARPTGSRAGRELLGNEVLVFRITDGLLAECWQFSYDQQAWDDFWA